MTRIHTGLRISLCLLVEAGSVVHARPAAPAGPAPRPGPTDLNLRISRPDANSFPLSPRWETDAPQRAIDPKTQCGDPPAHCTTVSVTEDKRVRGWPLCRETWTSKKVVGHWNWQPAAVTYSISESNGPAAGLAFDEWNAWPMDDDYDLSMAVPWPAALTNGNKDGVLNLEFEASETVDHFTTRWWSELTKKIRETPWTRRPIARTATVIGLLGLDRVHNYATELHPVYGLAALVETKRQGSSQVVQHWALFGRNWGGEGECASMAHDLPGDSIALDLPGIPGKSAVSVESATCLRTNITTQPKSVLITPVPGKGVSVRLPLGEAARHVRVSGELYLRWSDGGKSLEVPTTCTAPTLRAASEPEPANKAYDDAAFVELLRATPDTPEQTKARLLAASPEERRRYYDQTLAAHNLAGHKRNDDVNLSIRFSNAPARERR